MENAQTHILEVLLKKIQEEGLISNNTYTKAESLIRDISAKYIFLQPIHKLKEANEQ